MDNKEKKNSRTLTGKEQKALNAYFDGESGAKSERSLFDQVKGRDSVLKAELERLQSLRNVIRGWASDQRLDDQGRKRVPDIWSEIESEVTEIAAQRRASVFSRFPFDFAEWVRPATVAPAFALAILVLYIAIYPWQPAADNNQRMLVKNGTSGESSVLAQVEKKREEKGRPLRLAPLSMPEPVAMAYHREVRRASAKTLRARSMANIIDRNFVLGGLRASGADIDWIDSDEKFDLYPVADRSAPPVIWVAHRPSSRSGVVRARHQLD